MSSTAETPRKRSRNFIVLLPLVIFIGIAALFYFGLGAGDPSKLPSALIGKPVPATDLPPIKDLAVNGKPVPGLTTDALKGNVTLVNVWASWCVPCRDEAPLLEQLAKDTRFKMVGINYKDATDDARRFLNRFGNPFSAVGADEKGRTSIDWGVYGVPEAFVVDAKGVIRFKHTGPLAMADIDREIIPASARAKG